MSDRLRCFAASRPHASIVCFLAIAFAPQMEGRMQAQVPSHIPTPDTKRHVAELVGKMTLEEKVSQMQNGAAAIPRLGIPAYNWWSEGLHGVANSGYATVFPQAIGLAATWDAPLVHEVANVISTEARAKNSEALRHGNHAIYYGLDFWSPNINIFRDPRWGRGQETYGEDPFLTGRLGVAFVEGLQGDDPAYYKLIATPKHFAVHSGPETTRHTADVAPSAHDLQDSYLPAFRAAVTEAKAGSVMCAYNSLYGTPACASPLLLQKTLRGDWGFNGYVTTDCKAIDDFEKGHKFSPDLEHAAVAALRAGTDTSCGEEYAVLVKAVQNGLISEAEVDAAVERLFTARFQLGLFDDPAKVSYAWIPFSVNNSPEHRKLALETAAKSIVLLKNDGVLPLKKTIKVAVVGPNAASLAALEGNYSAVPSHPVLPLDGMEAVFGTGNVFYTQGSPYAHELPLPFPSTGLHPSPGDPRSGLKGEYFNDPSFQSSPVFTRIDKRIDFDWNAAFPANNVDAMTFGVRWSGTIETPLPGDYEFSVFLSHCSECGGDGVRVFFDSMYGPKGVSNQYDLNASTTVRLHFPDRLPHPIRIEYIHKAHQFGAAITLRWKPPVEAERDAAVAAAESADVIVAFVGLSPNLEGESMALHVEGFDGGDRTSIELPDDQQKLLEALSATRKPLVVVLLNGSALAVKWAKQHANAIVEAWYPGEEGGNAIASALSGDTNPGGRLPVTFYAATSDLPPFDDYSMSNRTYRYFQGTPLWGFGYGLSYSDFVWSHVKLSTDSLSAESLSAGDPMIVEADVENVSARAGDAVSELYLTPPVAPGSPHLALVGFDRATLAPHAKRHLKFTLDARSLSTVDASGRRAVRPGAYTLHVGGSQPNESNGRSIQTSFEILGDYELHN